MNLASSKRQWPLGRGFERYYGFLGGETNQWYPGPRLRQPPRRRPRRRPRRATTSRSTSPTRRSSSSRTPRRSPRTSRSSSTTAPAPRTRRTTSRRSGPTGTRARSTWATRRTASSSSNGRRSSGSSPRAPSCRRSIPYADTTSHDGKPWSQGDRVRPWDSLSEDEKRLFCRMAEVYAGFLSHADHELGRLLDYLEDSGQLDNTIIVLVSDNGASGEGGPNGSVNENKFFNGLPDTIEENLKYLDELGSPRTYNHYPTGWAWAFNTPVQDVEALRELRGRHRRPADRLVAGRDRGRRARSGASTTTRSTSCRRCTSASASSSRTSSTATPRSRSRASASRASFADPDAAVEGDAVLLDARHPRDLAQGLEGRDRRARPRPSRGGTSTSSAGSCSTPTTDPSECHDLAAEHPDKLQELIALWWVEAGTLPGAAARVARRDRDPRDRAAAALEPAHPLHLLPGRRGGARSRWRRTSATARTRSPPRWRSRPRRPAA